MPETQTPQNFHSPQDVHLEFRDHKSQIQKRDEVIQQTLIRKVKTIEEESVKKIEKEILQKTESFAKINIPEVTEQVYKKINNQLRVDLDRRGLR